MSLANHESFLAGEDLSSWQYKGVKLSSTEGEVLKCDAAGDIELCYGVLQDKPESGEEALVATDGATVYVMASAAVAIGAFVKVDANGKFLTSSADQENASGVALSAASADGDLFRVKLGRFERSTA